MGGAVSSRDPNKHKSDSLCPPSLGAALVLTAQSHSPPTVPPHAPTGDG